MTDGPIVKLPANDKGEPMCIWHGEAMVSDDDGQTWECPYDVPITGFIADQLAAAFDRAVEDYKP